MSRTIIRDCRVWDGSGEAAFPADLLIEGGHIGAVARNRGQLDGAGADVIEAGGMTLMLATDIRVTAEHATFALSEVKRGIIAANSP